MENRFTAVFQKTDKWWIAIVEKLLVSRQLSSVG